MCRKLMHLFLLAAIVGLAFADTSNAADPSLVGWWKLDDGSGTTAADSSGNESHGTLNGGLEWVEGVIRGALQFDGSTGHVEIPANINQAVINKGDFSMMAWIKTTDIAGTNYAFQQGDGNGTGRSWLFTVNGDIDTYVGVGNFSSGVIVELDEWYHAGFTVVENGSEDTLQMYVNGQASGDPGTRAMETCEGGYFIGSHKNLAAGSRWPGVIDDVRIYNRALIAGEFQKVMRGTPELAAGPAPADEQTDVLRDVTLAWTPGDLAATHDVYVGTSFDDVNDADRANPLGVLVSQNQVDATYDLTGLTFSQIYYWRVDEVNAAPDNTIFKGSVWSFTTELFAYPVENVTATSNGVSEEGVGPENTVDGSGLDADDQHSVDSADMWTATPGDETLTIQFEFDRVHKLYQMLVWNYNVSFEPLLGFGVKDATIEYSTDGANWTVLGDVVLAQATAFDTYTANTTIDFAGAAVKVVKLTVNSAYGTAGKFGLSEVRFLSIPVQPAEPQPADGAADVTVVDATLSWKAGREAATHDVYLSTDPNALTLIDSASDNAVDPGALDLGTTYYWKIDEVNEAEAIST